MSKKEPATVDFVFPAADPSAKFLLAAAATQRPLSITVRPDQQPADELVPAELDASAIYHAAYEKLPMRLLMRLLAKRFVRKARMTIGLKG